MPSYPRKEYSNRKIRDAGKVIKTDIFFDGTSVREEVVEAFKIAHNWRVAHGYPMFRERVRLSRYSKQGLTAGRIKAMASIRKKLKRTPLSLRDIQDFAGVRAILPDMDAVRYVAEKYRRNRIHFIRKIDDYIDQPKVGGYRSLHLITSFNESGEGVHYSGLKVEVQLRTQLQHVWATAVEAVGAMRGEDLKAGEGNADWLRLLELMSSYLAYQEGEQISQYVPQSQSQLSEEIREYEERLDAIANLSTFRDAVNLSETTNTLNGSYFVISLDTQSGTVSVQPKRSFQDGADGYSDYGGQSGRIQQVLVSVDRIDALKVAYPNYFLDVSDFLEQLTAACGSKTAFAAQPRKPSSIDRLDLSFLSKTSARRRPVFNVELEYTGRVLVDGNQIGRWEKGYYGTYYFRPDESEVRYGAIEDDEVTFKDAIQQWYQYNRQ